MWVEIVACAALVFALGALAVACYCWVRIMDTDFLEAMRRLWSEDEED